MHTLFLGKKRKAITLVELLIAISLLGIVGTLVSRWMSMNFQYRKRLTLQNDCDNNIRSAIWEMHKDLKTAKTILYPRRNSGGNKLISNSKIVFKNFQGDIICFYFNNETKEIIRELYHLIPNGDEPDKVHSIIGKGFDCVVFTNRNDLNNLVGIYLEQGPSIQIDSVFLMNSN